MEIQQIWANFGGNVNELLVKHIKSMLTWGSEQKKKMYIYIYCLKHLFSYVAPRITVFVYVFSFDCVCPCSSMRLAVCGFRG